MRHFFEDEEPEADPVLSIEIRHVETVPDGETAVAFLEARPDVEALVLRGASSIPWRDRQTEWVGPVERSGMAAHISSGGDVLAFARDQAAEARGEAVLVMRKHQRLARDRRAARDAEEQRALEQ